MSTCCILSQAAIAQLGERQTEDLKGPGSIPGLGTLGQPSLAKRTLFIILSNRQDFHLARNPWHTQCFHGHAKQTSVLQDGSGKLQGGETG